MNERVDDQQSRIPTQNYVALGDLLYNFRRARLVSLCTGACCYEHPVAIDSLLVGL